MEQHCGGCCCGSPSDGTIADKNTPIPQDGGVLSVLAGDGLHGTGVGSLLDGGLLIGGNLTAVCKPVFAHVEHSGAVAHTQTAADTGSADCCFS